MIILYLDYILTSGLIFVSNFKAALLMIKYLIHQLYI